MFRIVVAFFPLLVILLSPFMGLAAMKHPEVEFKRGAKKGIQEYLPAEKCNPTPCIVSQWGAIRLPRGIEEKYRVQMGLLHRGTFQSIALYQESTSFEQKLSERIFTKKPNRKILNLERMVETGRTNTLYIYGILLQYELDEGDLLALRLTSLKDLSQVEEYYFRYHHDGYKGDIDIAFIQPINIFTPNPGGVVQAAYSTAALSFSAAATMDPEKKYTLPGKMIRAVRGNLFLGLLVRTDVSPFNGDNITKDYPDMFGGLGLTFFDFLAMGYGGNFFRSPHTTFPFVGLEVRHMLEFLRSLKADTHTRWQKYLKEQMKEEPS